VARTGIYTDANATAVWQGAVAARRELNSQRNELQNTRRGVSEQLRNPMVGGPDRKGLEQQITSIDAQITALDKQVAAANDRVASAALVPGAVVEPRHERNDPPEAMFVMGGLFMVFVLFPLSVAFALRVLRRGRTTMTALPKEIFERFTRLDQAMDAMAVEIERIGEGQRFVTRVMGERPAEQAKLERGGSSPR
jgi:septal ring factor EnvC (AmiA/AmiB activator)